MSIPNQPRRETLARPQSTEEAIMNVEHMIEWCKGYITNASSWKNGTVTAGNRARAYMYNIRRNASTANKGMIMSDKLKREGSIAS